MGKLLAATWMLYVGLCLATYGICLATANDALAPAEMVGCGATLFIVFSFGSMLGPVLVTELMEASGPFVFFVFMAAVYGLMILYVIVLLLLPSAERLETPR